jgi:hypothetical protein
LQEKVNDKIWILNNQTSSTENNKATRFMYFHLKLYSKYRQAPTV